MKEVAIRIDVSFKWVNQHLPADDHWYDTSTTAFPKQTVNVYDRTDLKVVFKLIWWQTMKKTIRPFADKKAATMSHMQKLYLLLARPVWRLRDTTQNTVHLRYFLSLHPNHIPEELAAPTLSTSNASKVVIDCRMNANWAYENGWSVALFSSCTSISDSSVATTVPSLLSCSSMRSCEIRPRLSASCNSSAGPQAMA